MRFSRSLIVTSKDSPKDAVLPSHINLVRGGYIQQISSGIYNFLPLGKIVLDKIANVVRDELNSAGCHEVQLGFVTPCEMWQNSGRFEKYGKELFSFKDRKEQCYVLGPTHEEMMVELAKGYVKSYKQLPLNLYQINLKFRDELRPRFGLMRGREFLMKDGYSFHESVDDMMREFNLMEDTYKKIFKRLRLDFRVVDADSGAIGGSGSKEFMVLSDSGEDTIVMCSKCEYAANIEAAKRKPKEPTSTAPSLQKGKHSTPNKTTIQEIAEFFGIDSFYTLKAVAKRALYDGGKEEIVLFFIRGCDELQETKAVNAIKANDLLELSEEELANAGITAGFIGPYTLSQNFKTVFDEELRGARELVCGANEKDCHLAGVDLGEFENLFFFDIKEIKEGDICPHCGGELVHKKGIEVGHIFQLGTRYSEPLQAHFLDKDGKSKPFVMGTYGIGVSRLVQAVIEQNHDEKGSIFPLSCSAYSVMIIISNIKDEAQVAYAGRLYEDLKAKKIDALLDDRNERFGAKITDFELLGFPYCVVVGKGLENGNVEIVQRRGLQKEETSKDRALEYVLKMLS